MLKVITPATVEPLTLDEAKTFLRVDTDDENALISGLISAAREFAEHYTQAALTAVTYELALDAFPLTPTGAIVLPYSPVDTVESIKYTDSAGVEQTVPPDTYSVAGYGMTAMIYSRLPWPRPGPFPNPVRIRYSTSVASLSPVAKAAMLELIAHLYDDREADAGVPAGVYRLLDIIKVYS